MDILRFRDASGNAHAVGTANPLPVTPVGAGGAVASDSAGQFVKGKPLTMTNRSTTLSTASTQLAPANSTRTRLIIQNLSSTAVIWINFSSSALGLGLRLAPLEKLVLDHTSSAVFAIADTASTGITAWEF